MTTQALTDAPMTFSDSALAAEGLAVSVFFDLAEAEPAWRALETRAVTTPYQRFEWISAYCSAGFDLPQTMAIIVISEGAKPVALMPFGITRRFGVRIAQLIGMQISNSDALVYDPAYAARLTPEVLGDALGALNRAGARADLVSFHCLVPEWQGHANPLLAFPHVPAPNNLYLGTLDTGEGLFIDEALPHKRRTNIRRSRRRLVEGHGELSVRVAASVAEIERIHAVFLDQRARRFRKMGVENIFAQAPFQTLFRSLAIASLGDEKPIFRYHALYAGDEILATSLGVTTPTHYSQYINSTTEGPAAKYSLMGVMLSFLIDDLRRDGVVSFDMGLGDFDYKTDWTKATTVYDSVIPVSVAGRLAAPLLLAARSLKRTIKQTPALWAFARRILALRTRAMTGKS